TSMDKDRFNDFTEGMVTLPLIYLLERCSPREMARIKSVFGKQPPNLKDLEKLAEMMETYNVPQDVMKKANEFLDEAERSIDNNYYADISSKFDLLSLIKEQAENVQSSDRGWRFCGR
ncbi:MAG: hypothetical protein ABH883_04915, partial [Candidatus Omnitrophota bacterium]